jgi:hypothetical protein
VSIESHKRQGPAGQSRPSLVKSTNRAWCGSPDKIFSDFSSVARQMPGCKMMQIRGVVASPKRLTNVAHFRTRQRQSGLKVQVDYIPITKCSAT